jgi:hypothetical protein
MSSAPIKTECTEGVPKVVKSIMANFEENLKNAHAKHWTFFDQAFTKNLSKELDISQDKCIYYTLGHNRATEWPEMTELEVDSARHEIRRLVSNKGRELFPGYVHHVFFVADRHSTGDFVVKVTMKPYVHNFKKNSGDHSDGEESFIAVKTKKVKKSKEDKPSYATTVAKTKVPEKTEIVSKPTVAKPTAKIGLKKTEPVTVPADTVKELLANQQAQFQEALAKQQAQFEMLLSKVVKS